MRISESEKLLLKSQKTDCQYQLATVAISPIMAEEPGVEPGRFLMYASTYKKIPTFISKNFISKNKNTQSEEQVIKKSEDLFQLSSATRAIPIPGEI